MKIEKFKDGYAICGDCTSADVQNEVKNLVGSVPLIVADPPYGNIVPHKWDRTSDSDEIFSDWMVDWTRGWAEAILQPGGAFYVWGGIGLPGFRPFMKFIPKIEDPGNFELANLITWSKRRAIGRPNNYLFTREECAYFIKGFSKRPRTFNVPLLETKRGYEGFNPKYPAKSEYYRRTNVWTDINEIFRGKRHPTEKAQRLHEVMIEIHTAPDEWVVDPFAGAGTTAAAARKLGRKFVMIESNVEIFEGMAERLHRDDDKHLQEPQ